MKKVSTPKKVAAPTSKVEKEPKAKAPKKVSVKGIAIDKACETALSKLKELNIDEGLQSEIQWCLGSYTNDKNPSGLYVMAKRALAIFSVELAAKRKGVTAKLVSDLEKAIGNN